MAIPKEKHKPTQVTVSVIVGMALWNSFRGLWSLLVSNTTAMWLAVPSSIILAVAFYWWYGYLQDRLQDKPPANTK